MVMLGKHQSESESEFEEPEFEEPTGDFTSQRVGVVVIVIVASSLAAVVVELSSTA